MYFAYCWTSCSNFFGLNPPIISRKSHRTYQTGHTKDIAPIDLSQIEEIWNFLITFLSGPDQNKNILSGHNSSVPQVQLTPLFEIIYEFETWLPFWLSRGFQIKVKFITKFHFLKICQSFCSIQKDLARTLWKCMIQTNDIVSINGLMQQ